MPTEQQTGTRRSVAERLVADHDCRGRGITFQVRRVELIDAIKAALKDRDERAVRIIREHRESDVCKDNCWTTISAAIRNEDHK